MVKSPIERFNNFVYPDPNSGCHLFFGSWDQHGYGRISVGSTLQ